MLLVVVGEVSAVMVDALADLGATADVGEIKAAAI